MGQVGGVEVADSLAAEVEDLAVGQDHGRPVGHFVERDPAAEDTVTGAAGAAGADASHRFMAPHPQPADRHHPADRLAHLREQLTVAGVEEEGPLGHHQDRSKVNPDSGATSGILVEIR